LYIHIIRKKENTVIHI